MYSSFSCVLLFVCSLHSDHWFRNLQLGVLLKYIPWWCQRKLRFSLTRTWPRCWLAAVSASPSTADERCQSMAPAVLTLNTWAEKSPALLLLSRRACMQHSKCQLLQKTVYDPELCRFMSKFHLILSVSVLFLAHFIYLFIYLFIYWERGQGRGKREGEKHRCERETSIGGLSYAPQQGIEPATQACALTGNWPFALPGDAQPTKPHWSGLGSHNFEQRYVFLS